MAVKFQVQLKIRKPAADVFDAVVNPAKLSGYFVQKSSGPLVEGAKVKWKFPEFDGEVDVTVHEVVKNERIAFEWPAAGGGYNTAVEISFKPLDATNTMVQIAEQGWPEDEKGLQGSYGNAGGWMHMMCCMKGYLEYDINLRAGGAL